MSQPESLAIVACLQFELRRRTLNDFNQVLRDRRSDVYGEMLGTDARPGWY